MSHRHKDKSRIKRISKSRELLKTHEKTGGDAPGACRGAKLEFVLKCDSDGSLDAVRGAVAKINPSETQINIIKSGIGDVSHSDILMAETGSGLVVGFQVDVLPDVENELRNSRVDVHLYNVIYRMSEGIRSIAAGISSPAPEDEVTGNARVIALFKSVRKGVIAGAEIREGRMAVGDRFRVISAMGPVYSGVIKSMHIEKDAVQKAVKGQQVGIKIWDFNKVRIGDIIESYRPVPGPKTPVWKPKGEVVRHIEKY